MRLSVRSYIAEFIGTFTLVFIGTGVATMQQSGLWGMGPVGWIGIAFAFGFTLMVLVLAIGPVSGCHVNPAVSIAMAVAGRLKRSWLPGYIIAQIAGAIAASFVLMTLLKGYPGYDMALHGLGANGNPEHLSKSTLIGFEIVMAALFLFVIISSTRSDAPPGVSCLAIGGFLLVVHLVGAPLGDASVNPARSIGPAVFVGGDALRMLWVFIVGPIVGGPVGFVLYRLTYND